MNKQKVLASAQKLVDKGNFTKAIREYQRVLQADPQDVRLHLKIGDLYAKLGNTDDAVRSFEHAAQVHAQSGFLSKAIAVYKRALKLTPKSIRILTALANAYHKNGITSDAIAYFNAVAQLYLDEDDNLGYVDTMRAMQELDPDNVGFRIKLAEHFSTRGLANEAIEEFGVAASLLHATGRVDDYIKVLERLLFHQPEDDHKLKELACLYLDRGEALRALAKIQLCFKNDPENVETLGLLAQVFFRLEQPEKALQVLREKVRIVSMTGDKGDVRDAWSAILEVSPDDPEAQQALRTLKGPPQNDASDTAVPEIQRLLVETDVYIKYGLVEQSFEHLRKIFQLDPNSLDAMERVKEIHYQAGYLPQAVEELLKMARLCAQPDPERAISYLREALQIIPDSEPARALLVEWGLSWESLFPPAEKIDEHDLSAVDAMLNEFDGRQYEKTGAFSLGDDSSLTGQFNLPEDLESRIEEQELLNELDGVDLMEISEDDLLSIDVEIRGSEIDVGHATGVLEVEDLQAGADRASDEEFAFAIEECNFYIQQQLFQDALKTVVESLERWPGNAELIALQASIEQAEEMALQADRSPAAPIDAAALTETPLPVDVYEDDEVSPHLELGLAYRYMGLYQDAVGEFQASAQEGREVAQSLIWMGQCYLENNDPTQAIALFEQAAQYVKAATVLTLHVNYRIGLAYEQMGQFEHAGNYFQTLAQYAELFPDASHRVARLVPA